MFQMHLHQTEIQVKTVLLGQTHCTSENLRNATLQNLPGQNSPESINRIKAKRKGRE